MNRSAWCSGLQGLSDENETRRLLTTRTRLTRQHVCTWAGVDASTASGIATYSQWHLSEPVSCRQPSEPFLGGMYHAVARSSECGSSVAPQKHNQAAANSDRARWQKSLVLRQHSKYHLIPSTATLHSAACLPSTLCSFPLPLIVHMPHVHVHVTVCGSSAHMCLCSTGPRSSCAMARMLSCCLFLFVIHVRVDAERID